MFRLRPSRAWQESGIKLFVAAGDSLISPRARWTSLKSLFWFGRQSRLQSLSGRRATDSLGRSAPGTLSWKNLLGPTGVPVKVEFSSGEWLSPLENAQLIELHENADNLISDLTQADSQIAALQEHAMRNGSSADIGLTAQQSFARVDSEMQRWNIRADEIERANDPQRVVAFNPSGSLFAGPMHYIRSLWQRSWLSTSVQPPRVMPPPSVREQRRANIRQDLQRMNSPALRLRQHDVRIKAMQAEKMATVRAQLNSLAQPRSSGLRRIAVARLANIHDKVGHLALELHQHRLETGTKVGQRLDRRRQPRSAEALPAPVYKPKQKQGESV